MTPQAHPARRLLGAELAKSEAELDLARAVLLVAKEEYRQLSVELYLARLDQMAEEVRDRLADETAPLVVLQAVLETLFERRKLSPNREAHYDPRNSFLNDVLDRGVGIPLTLGIVLLEVGWRLGLPLEGVNFPGRFLVRFRGETVSLLIDVYEGGEIHFNDDAQSVLDRVYGGTVRFQSRFVRTATKRHMLRRLLTNLKDVYLRVHDDRRALAVVERLLMVEPIAPVESRTRAVLLARLGRHEEAADQFEAYLRVAPGAEDFGEVEEIVRELRAGNDVDPGPVL